MLRINLWLIRAYGRDIAIEEGGNFTEFGYVRDTGDRFYEEYDGNPENIPEEYRVKAYELDEEKLSEADRVDMATDIAYDLDDFFRQHDSNCRKTAIASSTWRSVPNRRSRRS